MLPGDELSEEEALYYSQCLRKKKFTRDGVREFVSTVGVQLETGQYLAPFQCVYGEGHFHFGKIRTGKSSRKGRAERVRRARREYNRYGVHKMTVKHIRDCYAKMKEATTE